MKLLPHLNRYQTNPASFPAVDSRDVTIHYKSINCDVKCATSIAIQSVQNRLFYILIKLKKHDSLVCCTGSFWGQTDGNRMAAISVLACSAKFTYYSKYLGLQL